MTVQISIRGRQIGSAFPPYVIAEMSANHNGSIDRAFAILNAAKEAGADAIKLQTYRADTITLKSDAPEFMITDGLWKGKSLYELYEWAHTPWEWHKPLFDRARELDITIFSSPFDHSAIDMLEDLGAVAYKIASFEAVDLPLVRHAASTGKPLIISTGMADDQEIEEVIAAAREAGCRELALLRCVSGYPAPPAEYNLRTIPDMASRFGVVVGLSDHTLDNATAVTSVALGVSLIEKHFTMDRSGGGPDDSFSLEPPDLAALCRDVRTAWTALGKVDYGCKPSETASIKLRRSLYFVRDLAAGASIQASDVRSVRPGYGMAPKHLDSVIGSSVIKDVSANTPVLPHLIKPRE